MSAWTWALVGLAAAGVLLPLFPAVAILRSALHLRSRVAALQQSRLITSLESMQLQAARLESIAAQAPPLLARAKAAAETIRQSAAASRWTPMRDALGSAGEEISRLSIELR